MWVLSVGQLLSQGRVIGAIMPPTTSTPKEKKAIRCHPNPSSFWKLNVEKLHVHSVSAALEEIFQTVSREEKLKAIDDAFTKYYDSLTDEEVEQDKQWAAFAVSVFPRKEA